MAVPQTLLERIRARLNTSIQSATPIAGGDINQAARIETASARFFVKWHAQSPAGMFTAEAKGLARLASAEALRLPEVILLDEENSPPFLLLEWLDLQRPTQADRLAERLAEGLARLHQQGAAQHGLDHPNFIGSLPQKNTLSDSWADFYADLRIGEQMKIARQTGRLPPAREKLLNDLRKRLPDLLPRAEPSLLHGDLWGGNYASLADNQPLIYDPAVYYGHREVELAFTELFGGFPARFYEAYHSAYPIEPGYQERKSLYQLYPLMVHMNLFGGGYAAQVDSIARRYVGG